MKRHSVGGTLKLLSPYTSLPGWARFFYVTHKPSLIYLISNRTMCCCKTCLEPCFMAPSTHQREYDCSAAALSVNFSDIMLIAFQSFLTHCSSKTQGKWYWMGYTCTEFLLSTLSLSSAAGIIFCSLKWRIFSATHLKNFSLSGHS